MRGVSIAPLCAKALGDVREPHSLRTCGVVVEPCNGPEDRLPLGWWELRAVAAREDEIDEVFAIEPLVEGELCGLDQPEESALVERRIHVVRANRLVADDCAQPCHPRVTIVARVPDEREPASRSKDARDLGHGSDVIEPMERLPTCDDIGRGIGQRDRLGAARERLHRRHRGLQLRAHLVERLDCADVMPESDERAAQLPRSRTEVDHVAGLVTGQPTDGLVRISGATALVRPGDVREGRIRAAHPRIAVDDHIVESREAPRPYRVDMRVAVVLMALLAVPLAFAGSIPEPTVLPKPRFPAPAKEVTRTGPRLVLVSSRYRDPGSLPPERPEPPSWAPRAFRSAELDDAVRQHGRVFLVYEGRYVIGASPRTQSLRYAFDVGTFTRPPSLGEFEPVTWAREVDGVLYISNSHLTYASQTRGRNAYVSAIDVAAKKTLWRSPALVANAAHSSSPGT